MKWDVEILKTMIEMEYKFLSQYQMKIPEERIGQINRNIRHLAALIENDGEPMDGVTPDTTQYRALQGHEIY